MNTRHAVQRDAVPPANLDDSPLGAAPLIAQQVHVVTGPEMAGAPNARDSSFGAPDTAQLAKEINNLSAQNERLIKSVDTLLRLHENEKAQRQSLQTTLDRLLEEIGIPTSVQSLEAVGTEVRNGVSEDLRPLLHAIIELLELSMRRAPAAPAIPPEPSDGTGAAGCRAGDVSRANASGQLPREDLPGALPEILTKSVEELVGNQRASRPKTIEPNESRSNARSPVRNNETDTAGKERRTGSKRPRSQAWIPVTSGTLNP